MAKTITCALSAILLAGCLSSGARLRFPPPASAAVSALVRQARQQLHHNGQPGKAAALARKALARDPDHAGAHAVLGLTAKLADDPLAAADHWIAALADTRSPLTGLYLNMIPIQHLGHTRLARLARLTEALSRRHPKPQSRAEALAVLGQLQLRLGWWSRARRSVQRQALLGRWMGIAGFDNAEGKGYDTPYPPEREIALDRSYPGARGQVGWRAVELSSPEPMLELNQRFYPFSRNVAYLVTYVSSPKDQDVVLELVTTAPLKAWVNDRNVLAAQQVRQARHRQFRIPVRLRKGANKLLLKSCSKHGNWYASAWIARPDGTPLALQSTIRPAPYVRDKRPPLPWDPTLALPPGVTDLPAGPRRELWTALGLTTAGLFPSAISAISRYNSAQPRDPVGLLYGALLHRAEGQLQRTTRLLERGLGQVRAPHNARFWVEQARLYLERGQHDKTFDALGRARAVTPKGLRLAQQLDRLYSSKGWNLDRCKHALQQHRRQPDWAWPVSVLARCSGRLGRKQDALRWLQLDARLTPRSEDKQNSVISSLLALGRCDRALALQRRSTRRWPGRASSQLAMGDVLRRCTSPQRALKAYRRAAQIIPDWHLPHVRIGLVHYELGATKKAIASWRRALALNPEATRLWDRVTHLRPDHDPVLQRLKPGPKQIRAVLATARTVKPVDGASLVWLLDHEVSRLMPDGTMKRVITTVRMAVDRAGRDALGSENLPRGGMLKVLEAYTVDPKGRRREVTSMHGRKVRFPALEEGALVVLQYRHVQRPAGYLRHHLSSTWLFQHSLAQVARAEWVLAMPAHRKLNVHIQGKVTHQTRREGALVLHHFSTTDVPPLRPERSSPPAADLLRLVQVSSVPSWDYFSEWGRSLTAEVFEVDPQLNQTLQRVARGKQTVAQKIRAVYHHVLTNVRYQQDYETFIAGVKPHPASVVHSRAYGDCKDKSVLIIAMLRQLGIKANLALVRTRGVGHVRPEVPSQQFNHAVVYLPPQPGLGAAKGRFLDATAENLDIDALRHDIQGTLSLVLFPDAFRLIRIPYQAPERTHGKMQLELTLAPDGSGTVAAHWTARGRLAGSLRKPLQNKQVLGQFAQMLVHRNYPECQVRTDSVRVTGQRTVLQPLQLRMKLTCGAAARKEGQILRLRLPKLFSEATSAGRWAERRHPLFFGPPAVTESRLEITLPAGVTVASLPAPVAIKGWCLQLAGKWQRTAAGLSYEQSLRRTCAELPASRYPALRASVEQMKRHFAAEAVLSAAPAKPARNARRGR